MRLFKDIRVCVAASLSLVLLSAPAWAEEAEAGQKGLPQFDPAFFPAQIFWLVVHFAVLYLLMSLVALPRIVRTQENRKKIIATELDAARDANETAKTAVAAVEKSLGDARAKAQASVSEMLADVAEESAQHQTAKEKELSRRLHREEAEIAVARADAMKEVHTAASDLASAIVTKILESKERVRA